MPFLDGSLADAPFVDGSATDGSVPDLAVDPTSFFVTSVGTGSNGGNLGGLAGADAHCAELAEGAGHFGRTWTAYLSTSTENAADRIGPGPWGTTQ